MIDQPFLYTCSTCKDKTNHIIGRTSKKRGVKLMCLRCGEVKSRYINLNKLQQEVK